MNPLLEYQRLRLMTEAELQRELRRTKDLDSACAVFLGAAAVMLTMVLCWLLP